MEQKPSIGRIVHYVDKEGIHNAAIILEVHGDLEDMEVTLITFSNTYPSSMIFKNVSYYELELDNEAVEYTKESWHFPERI